MPKQPSRKLDRRELLKQTAIATSAIAATGLLGSASDASSKSVNPLEERVSYQTCFDLLKKPGGKIPVIYDTDIGSDIDDTWALLFLLNSPELDVKLISADAGQGIYRAKVIAKFLERVGRTDIPIAMSHRRKNGVGHQQDWVKDYDLDQYPGKVHKDAVIAIQQTVKASSDPVTIICVGAVPNIQAAIDADPSFLTNSRFVGMHGSIKKGYGDSGKPVPEANVKTDPKALQKVFSHADKWECSITPLDTCGIVDLAGARYQKVFSADSPGVKSLLENYMLWLTRVNWLPKKPNPITNSSTLFDIVAVYMAFSESLLEMENLPVEVTDDGMTIVNQSAHEVRVAMRWKDLDAFKDMVVERIIKAID